MEYNNLSPENDLQQTISLDPKELSKAQSEVKVDQATATALEADRRVTWARQRNLWRTGGEGVIVASQAIERLFKDLKERVASDNEMLKSIRLEINNADAATCNITNGDVSLLLKWISPTNKVQDCSLQVSVDVVKSPVTGDSETERTTSKAFESAFEVDVNENSEMIWRRKGSSHQELRETSWLTDYCYTTLIGYIQRREEGYL
jgi:hypothetical protein